MALTSMEYDAILNDASKRIVGDIFWQDDEDHSPSVEFRAEIRSDAGWPLFIRGSHNPLIPATTFTMILKTVGRIYGLDLGKDHHNPQCTQVGEKHKHKWTEQFRDKEAYEPYDITANASDPVSAWRRFCKEARITHEENMQSPPLFTGDFILCPWT